MFDPTVEQPISLREATKLPALRKNGKRPHLATLFRWSTTGCRGVRLETIQVGGSRCTSEAAVLRFIEELTHPGRPKVHSPRRSEIERDRQDEAELAAAGI